MKTVKTCVIGLICICFNLGLALGRNRLDSCKTVQDTVLHKLVYIQTDTIPEPVDGMAKLTAQVFKGVHYPKTDSIYIGRIQVAFIVEPDGEIDGQRTLRDPSGNKNLFGSQVLNIIGKIKWKPAMCNGRPVPSLVIIPYIIDISDE